tara:strand:+ start:6004 stop:7833 length:1830 start_codon:yes stop_codon:yes gene_type:complete
MKNPIVLFYVLLFPFYWMMGQKLQLEYVGNDHTYNTNYHDGQMLPAIGTHNFQILRANRSYPAMADDLGWTYNHAPNLAYWNGFFWCQYLSTPMGEHSEPGISLITKSKDGILWEKPKIIFPIYFYYKKAQKYIEVKNTIMHQRMAFYVAPNGKLLAFGHYGGNDGDGIGRVVREVKNDFNFGPIYFIRINEEWRGNIAYPHYKNSSDKEFVAACKSFLDDPVRRIQWWEEDFLAHDSNSFYLPYERQKAFTFYSISDSLKIGLFKSRMTISTRDGGMTWSEPSPSASFKYGGAKIWGQKLDNNQYALVYNPTDNKNRHPLGVASSDDGLNFNNLSLVHGEVPIKRYWGIEKRPGPQYVRGISEGNGNPPGNDLWVVYSVSKEDIWVSKIPVPISRVQNGKIEDTFNQTPSIDIIEGWNIYRPKWCPVSIQEISTKNDKSLCLEDFDPSDYAKAVRVLEKKTMNTLSFDLYLETLNAPFFVDLNNSLGQALIRFSVNKNNEIKIEGLRGNKNEKIFLERKQWYPVKIEYNANKASYDITIKNLMRKKDLSFLSKGIPHRIEFRTGFYRLNRKIQEYKSGDQRVAGFDEQGTEQTVEPTEVCIDNFKTDQ